MGSRASTLRFRREAFRAITINELSRLKDITGSKIIIIEQVDKEEYQSLKVFIENYKDSSYICFFLPSGDNITGGIADEYDLDIYTDRYELISGIEKNCNISITNSDKSSDANDSIDGIDFETIDSGFSDALSTVQSEAAKQKESQTKVPCDISSKDDLDTGDIFDTFSDNDLGIAASESPKEVETEQETKKSLTDNAESEKARIAAEKEVAELKNQLDTIKNELDSYKKQLDEAVTKVSELNKVIRAVKDERDIFQKELQGIASSEIIVDPLTVEQYNEMQLQLESLRATIESGGTHSDLEIKNLESEKAKLEEKVSELSAKIADLEETNTMLEAAIDNSSKSNEEGLKIAQAEFENLKSKLASEAKSRTLLEDRLASENSSTQVLRIMLNRAIRNIQNLNKDNSELSHQIDTLKEDIASYQQTLEQTRESALSLEKLRSNMNKINAEKDSLNDRIFELSNEVSDKNREIQQLNRQITELKAQIEDSDSVVSSSEERVKAIQEHLNSRTQELEDARKRLLELQESLADAEHRVKLANNYSKNEITSLNERLNTTNNQLAGARASLSEAESEADNLRIQLESANAKIASLNKQLSDSKTRIETLSQVSSSGSASPELSMRVNDLERLNAQLNSQIHQLKQSLTTQESEKAFLKKTISDYEVTQKQLNDTIKRMSSGRSAVTITPASIRDIEYTASNSGKIIAVAGSGSFGITTTALSIAQLLATSNRVLLIDFDMTFAKLDIMLKTDPFTRNVPGITDKSKSLSACSGLGILADFGVDVFCDYASAIIKKPIKTKGGCVDYLSGFYIRRPLERLAQIDFSKFLRYCSNNYNYIVIDFGKLRSSDTSDRILEVFGKVSYRNVVVSATNYFDIRNTTQSIRLIGWSMDKSAWVLNMAKDTKLNEKSRGFVQGFQSICFIPFLNDFYGNESDFTKDKMARDKLLAMLHESRILN